MKMWETAFIRMRCRPWNTALLSMLFILLSVSLLILSGFFQLTQKRQLKYDETISGEVIVRCIETSYAKAEEGYGFSEWELNELIGTENETIANKIAIAFGFAESFEVKKEAEMGVAIQLAAGTYADSGEIPDIALMGVQNSQCYNWFVNDIYQLSTGEHISEKDGEAMVALISQGIARRNHLDVGSKIRIIPENSSDAMEFTIKGIFSAEENGADAARSNHENRIIIPIETFKILEGDQLFCEAVIRLEKAALVDLLLNKIADSESASINNARVITNNYEYVEKSSVLSGMQQYLKITIATLFLSTLLIICLYMIYQNMTRQREFQILLSRGAGKCKIAGTIFVETLMPLVIGITASLVLCAIIYGCFGSGFHYQDVQVQSLEDILNTNSITFVLCGEVLTVLLGMPITLLCLNKINKRII